MARVRLYISQHIAERWVSPDMILGKYEPPAKQAKQTKKYRVEVVEEAVKAAPCNPKVGQVVEVYRRGAAWVTKCYYNSNGENSELEKEGEDQKTSFPTHVDVRYILGSSTEEKMVPIESIRLAPELDPDSGRSQRVNPKEIKSD
jgi:hypothetical protein